MSKIPDLSLVDVCLAWLLQHPEVDRKHLPLHLQSYITAREQDEKYRVQPPYDQHYHCEFTQNLYEMYMQFDNEHHLLTSRERIQFLFNLLTYIHDHIKYLWYNPKFAQVLQNKHREFGFHNPTAQRYFDELNKFHCILFGSHLQMSPPQYSYGFSYLNPLFPLEPSTQLPWALHHTITSISDGHLDLRPLEISDGEALLSSYGGSNLSQKLHLPQTPAGTRDWIQLGHQYRQCGNAWILGIFQVKTQQLIGVMGLFHLDLDTLEGLIGYWIDPTFYDQKLGCRALKLFYSWVQELLNLECLEILVDSDNDYTRVIIQEAGFSQVVEPKQTSLLGYSNVILYSRQRNEELFDEPENQSIMINLV
jgi:RimJ/RimL family protein N-acetyltransferase